MKTALTLLISYLSICICGIALCGLLYMVCEGLGASVVGQPMLFFSFVLFKKGMLFSSPIVFAFTNMHMILKVLRINTSRKHTVAFVDRNLVVGFLCYLLFTSVTWFVFFPLSISFGDGFFGAGSVEMNRASTGYFRKSESGIVYFFTKVHENGKADGILYDTNAKKSTNSDVIAFTDIPSSSVSSYPYSDVLVKNAIKTPKIVTYCLKVYQTLVGESKISWNNGIFSWILYSSMALALVSIFGLQFTSSWRLLNTLGIFIATACVFFLNYLCYADMMPNFFMDLDYLLKFIDHASVVIMNFLIFALCTAFGIIMCIYRRRIALRHEAEQDEIVNDDEEFSEETDSAEMADSEEGE